jgi:ferredoxin
MTYSDEELTPSHAPDFPVDRSPEVCAAGAIVRPTEVGPPIIDGERCVLCGVCAVRCPVGAIRLMPAAVVDDSPNAIFLETPKHPQAAMLALRRQFESLQPKGTFLVESGAVVDSMKMRLDEACRRIGDKFQNHLARNLFMAIGIAAAMRRRGDNAVRTDLLLGSPEGGRGLAEVEFGYEAVLDSPRDVLDDIAVLVGRRGWGKAETAALIVSDVLPNRRSEYWRIIQDIDRVVGVHIRTVTVLSLMLLTWDRRTLSLADTQAFYADVDTDSYRRVVLEKVLRRPLKLDATPRSHVEVAK